MHVNPSHLVFLFMVNLLLSACAPMETQPMPPMRRAICNQLKSDLVLNNPGTSDERVEEIQHAESYLRAYSYDVNCENVKHVSLRDSAY